MLCYLKRIIIIVYHYYFLIYLSFVVFYSTKADNISSLFPTTCRLTRAAREYAGTLSTTANDQTCDYWATQSSQNYTYAHSTNYPEGSAIDALNFCRNPNDINIKGLWCYTSNPYFEADFCEVPFCDCKLTEQGVEYEGEQNRTIGGNQCQNWKDQTPNAHPYRNRTYFPDKYSEYLEIDFTQNFCRNPNGSQPNGPWCYTTEITEQGAWWDYCNVTFCDVPMMTADELRVRADKLRRMTTLPPTASTRRSTLVKTMAKHQPRTMPLEPSTIAETEVSPIPDPQTSVNYLVAVVVPIVLIVLIASILGGFVLLVRIGRIRPPKFPSTSKYRGTSAILAAFRRLFEPKVKASGSVNHKLQHSMRGP